MPRIRSIKPELGAHEGLYDLERDTGLPIRFAWAMLFTVADREGRFKWQPRTLKVQILPHDDLEFSRVLDAWVTRGFIVKYRVKNEWFGWIPTFTKHQVINNRETASDLPCVSESDEIIDNTGKDLDACTTREARVDDDSGTREARVDHASPLEGKGKEGSKSASQTTPKRSSKPRQQKRPIPEDFQLTPERQQYAEKHLPQVDAASLLETFRSTSKAKRWEYYDWDQHWQTLVRQWAPNSGHWSSGQYPRKANGAGQQAMFDPQTGQEVRW